MRNFAQRLAFFSVLALATVETNVWARTYCENASVVFRTVYSALKNAVGLGPYFIEDRKDVADDSDQKFAIRLANTIIDTAHFDESKLTRWPQFAGSRILNLRPFETGFDFSTYGLNPEPSREAELKVSVGIYRKGETHPVAVFQVWWNPYRKKYFTTLSVLNGLRNKVAHVVDSRYEALKLVTEAMLSPYNRGLENILRDIVDLHVPFRLVEWATQIDFTPVVRQTLVRYNDVSGHSRHWRLGNDSFVGSQVQTMRQQVILLLAAHSKDSSTTYSATGFDVAMMAILHNATGITAKSILESLYSLRLADPLYRRADGTSILTMALRKSDFISAAYLLDAFKDLKVSQREIDDATGRAAPDLLAQLRDRFSAQQ